MPDLPQLTPQPLRLGPPPFNPRPTEPYASQMADMYRTPTRLETIGIPAIGGLIRSGIDSSTLSQAAKVLGAYQAMSPQDQQNPQNFANYLMAAKVYGMNPYDLQVKQQAAAARSQNRGGLDPSIIDSVAREAIKRTKENPHGKALSSFGGAFGAYRMMIAARARELDPTYDPQIAEADKNRQMRTAGFEGSAAVQIPTRSAVGIERQINRLAPIFTKNQGDLARIINMPIMSLKAQSSPAALAIKSGFKEIKLEYSRVLQTTGASAQDIRDDSAQILPDDMTVGQFKYLLQRSPKNKEPFLLGMMNDRVRALKGDLSLPQDSGQDNDQSGGGMMPATDDIDAELSRRAGGE